MADKKVAERTKEREQLLSNQIIEEEIPLVKGSKPTHQEPRGTFKEQNLLIVEQKKKFVPQQRDETGQGDGVLSIPPEDPPNNCKSKSSTVLLICLSVSFRVLLVPVLSPVLPMLLLLLLEGKGVQC